MQCKVVDSMPKARGKRRQVFVAYSYRLYAKDDYRKVYKEIERFYDVTFIFADEKITNMHIMKKIESFIRDADFSIFDISGWNPNVTLELGFAMALGDQWYIAIDPSKTEVNEVPSDLRGLDRIQYNSYSDLGAQLQTVMAQRYPKRPQGTIDTYLADQRRQVLSLLRGDPGLTITSIAQLLGVEVQVAQLVVRPLTDSGALVTQGRRKGVKYFLPNQVPRLDGSSRRTKKSVPPPRQSQVALFEEHSLNEKESTVMALLQSRGSPLHLDEIAATCFPEETTGRGNSWARNSLRKLVEQGLVKRSNKGVYLAVEPR